MLESQVPLRVLSHGQFSLQDFLSLELKFRKASSSWLHQCKEIIKIKSTIHIQKNSEQALGGLKDM